MNQGEIGNTFMGISKACDYGILVVSFFASNPKGYLKSKHDIASALNLPEEFLSKILQQLVKNNIVESIRGSHGGYKLLKSPQEISLKSVIEVFEGEMHMIDCLDDNFEDCGRQNQCKPLQNVMHKVENEINQILSNVSFKELAMKG